MNIQPSVLCAGFRWNAGGNTALSIDETSPTVTSSDPPAVAKTLKIRGGCEGGDGSVAGAIPATQSGKQVNGVADDYSVRRLTPRECERLQGFPDDWTKVPYKGKPEDECPDTPRYKAIGNSMAVPVMRWIGERMQKAEEACQSTL